MQNQDWDEVELYEPRPWELGNCPNCAEVVVREQRWSRNQLITYWPCMECGFIHYGERCPDLD